MLHKQKRVMVAELLACREQTSEHHTNNNKTLGKGINVSNKQVKKITRKFQSLVCDVFGVKEMDFVYSKGVNITFDIPKSKN